MNIVFDVDDTMYDLMEPFRMAHERYFADRTMADCAGLFDQSRIYSDVILEQERQGIEQITPAYDRFKSWAEEFDTAALEQQKMIACHLFKRIEVGRDYQIKAELNMTYKQFCSEWGGNNLLGEAIG